MPDRFLFRYMFSAQSAPFIATAMGGYYAEAMESGATREQATLYGLIAGTAEGALESLNVDNWINNRIGGGRFIKQVQAAGRDALRQGYTKGKKVIGLASSALGEGAEEGASYLISTLMRKATFDPNAEISGSELLEQAFMGALIGVFGAEDLVQVFQDQLSAIFADVVIVSTAAID